jgi:outer membrane scaffolding protein for murein synthesis (MipA/OmpV family)
MPSGKRIVRIASLVLGLGIALVAQASAQTPTPLSYWQFSAGQVLAPYGKKAPDWLVLAGPSVALQPTYEGSNRYEFQPGAILELQFRGRVFLSTGQGLAYDVFRGRNYRMGVGISYDIGRSDHHDGIRGLGSVDATPQARVYGDHVFRVPVFGRKLPLIFSWDFRRAIGGYNGILGSVGAYLPILGSEEERYFVFLGGSGTYMDSETAGTYFSVTPAQSARSGLPTFKANGGPENFGLGLSSGWFVTDRWLVTADLAGKRFLGDFRHSPVVKDRWQLFSSVGIAYVF